MPQLHFYVPEELANTLRNQARVHGVSISKYLASLVRREVAEDWPKDFFTKVVGGWHGEFPTPHRPTKFEKREKF